MSSLFGGNAAPPIPPVTKPPPAPPQPLPPAAIPSDKNAQRAISAENKRIRRRVGTAQTMLTGVPIGIGGDRPLGT